MVKKVDVNNTETVEKTASNNNSNETEKKENKKSSYLDNISVDKVVAVVDAIAKTETGKKIKEEGKELLTKAAVTLVTKKSVFGLKGMILSEVAGIAIKHSGTVINEGKKWLNEMTADATQKTDLIRIITALTSEEKYKNKETTTSMLAFLTTAAVKEDLTKNKADQWLSIIDSGLALEENSMTQKEISPVICRMIGSKISEEAKTVYAKHFKVAEVAVPKKPVKAVKTVASKKNALTKARPVKNAKTNSSAEIAEVAPEEKVLARKRKIS